MPTSIPTGESLERLLRHLTARERRALDELLAQPPSLRMNLFPAQRAFVTDTAKFKTAVCSRRAGKTIGAAVSLLEAARKTPNSVGLYITRSQVNARRIVWRTLTGLNVTYRLGGVPNETQASLALPNGSTIYLLGAKDRDKIEDYRGLGLVKVVIDETQNLPDYLERMIDDVLEPALMDHDGSIELIGTPGPIPIGYFYDRCNDPAWSHHAWTVFDNPHILRQSKRTPEEYLARTLARRQIDSSHPSVQREWYGRWVLDRDSLVFSFHGDRNHFDELPPAPSGWSYVMGIDIGFDDADAVVVLAFSADHPAAYVVEEYAKPKQQITPLIEQLKALAAKYQPVARVIDTAGLGRKVAEEINLRSGLGLVAAEKTRKIEYIAILNDALESGLLKVRAGSPCERDALLLEWDTAMEKPDRKVVSRRFHSDILDALLYAFRESGHWRHQAKPPPPSDLERDVAEAERLMSDARAALTRRDEGWGLGVEYFSEFE